jgi:hypothetical protein
MGSIPSFPLFPNQHQPNNKQNNQINQYPNTNIIASYQKHHQSHYSLHHNIIISNLQLQTTIPQISPSTMVQKKFIKTAVVTPSH